MSIFTINSQLYENKSSSSLHSLRRACVCVCSCAHCGGAMDRLGQINNQTFCVLRAVIGGEKSTVPPSSSLSGGMVEEGLRCD